MIFRDTSSTLDVIIRPLEPIFKNGEVLVTQNFGVPKRPKMGHFLRWEVFLELDPRSLHMHPTVPKPRALTTWEHFGPILLTRTCCLRSENRTQINKPTVTKIGEKKMKNVIFPKSRFLPEMTKITQLHRKRDQSLLELLIRLKVQKWSTRAKLFENKIFVAARNFWRQQMLRLLPKCPRP